MRESGCVPVVCVACCRDWDVVQDSRERDCSRPTDCNAMPQRNHWQWTMRLRGWSGA